MITDSVVVYRDLFPKKALDGILREIYKENPVVISLLRSQLLKITDKLYEQKQRKRPISTACILLEDYKKIPRGSLLLAKEGVKLPKMAIHMYEYKADLPVIYRTIEDRIKYAEHVRNLLSDIKGLPVWDQCVQKKLKLQSFLGKGSYGNVFDFHGKFAVKLSKLKEDATKKAFDPNFNSWHEIYILENVLRRIITARICPNLPIVYESFACRKCDIALEDKHIDSPCAITAVELAQGTLKSYLKEEKPDLPRIHSAFFQILAGISAIQYFGQIMNFDVKKENILVYDVKPGGYWRYQIRGVDFYVPNYGKMFVLNDFGISRTMSPLFPIYKSQRDRTFRLGSRYAMVSEGKFVPIDCENQTDENFKPKDPVKITWDGKGESFGAEFRMDRGGRILPVKTDVEITEKILLNSDLCPPFEFYNDTQDAIRMFTGGKRTTQKGEHSKPVVPKKFLQQLRKFSGQGESAKSSVFSTDPAQVLASFLIVDFFSEFTDYTDGEGKTDKLIESFFYPTNK